MCRSLLSIVEKVNELRKYHQKRLTHQYPEKRPFMSKLAAT